MADAKMFRAFFGLLMVAVVSGQVTIQPESAIGNVGGSVEVLCQVNYPIDSCRVVVAGQSYRMQENLRTGDVIYHGQGFQQGQCGAVIRNIKEEWNGDVQCVVPPKEGPIELMAHMRLIVARPPDHPTLMFTPGTAFREGESFAAQCVVPNGRPSANISWFKAFEGHEEPILNGIHAAVYTTDPERDLQTISQNLTLVLSADDDGKSVLCRAGHVSWENTRDASKQLVVNYPPRRLDGDGPITIFGLKLGSVGLLNVTVRANPMPAVSWRVDGEVLRPGQVSERGVAALQPVLLGNGIYNISLRIEELTTDDVARQYQLIVGNELDEKTYVLTISTLDEPVGVELDTGAIVGIVLAVLVLLIAVSLLVFAKATDRWCFAGGRGRDHVKSSGESTPAGDVLLESGMALSPTDTESAVGGRERSRLAELSRRVRGVLPRAKDKVQATDAPQPAAEQKPLSEEKKGVVYAELQLGEQTAEKPPPPSTEYAEIVYTDQPKEAKE